VANAHNIITEMHSALRLDVFTQAKRLGPCHAVDWFPRVAWSCLSPDGSAVGFRVAGARPDESHDPAEDGPSQEKVDHQYGQAVLVAAGYGPEFGESKNQE